jgi:ABC-type bacteriocin/lantibiotic exporter with double-glycine peptidase domain
MMVQQYLRWMRFLLVISRAFWLKACSLVGVSLVSVAASLLSPLVGKYIFDVALPSNRIETLFLAGSLWLVLSVGKSLFANLKGKLSAQIHLETANVMKAMSLRSCLLECREEGKVDGRSHDERLSLILVDIDTVVNNAGLGVNLGIVLSVLSLVACMLYLIHLDGGLALMCFAGALFSLLLQRRKGQQIVALNEKIALFRKELTQMINNILALSQTVVRHEKINPVVGDFDVSLRQYNALRYKALCKELSATLQYSVATDIVPVLLLWFGALKLFQKAISLGTLIAFISYLGVITSSLKTVFGGVLGVISALGQGRPLIALLTRMSSRHAVVAGAPRNLEFGTLSYRDIHIQRGAFCLVCHRLELDRGKTYFLEGRSGSGKSTFLQFLGGLRKASQALIFRDRQRLDLDEYQQEAIAFGYIQKDELLFNRSVRENIYWNGDNPARAGLTDFLHLTDKLELPANILSAGEVQRVCLARELLRRPKLLILDEAIDSIEEEFRGRIYNFIRQVCPGITLICATHNWNSDHLHVDGHLTIEDGVVKQRKCLRTGHLAGWTGDHASL